MKNLWKLFQTRSLVRPTVYLAVYKSVAVLLLSLLWDRFLDHGQRGLGFAFAVFGLILLLLSWFHYLSLDGVNPIRNMKKNRAPKKRTRFRSFDMIDFADEPIHQYEDLEPEERSACQFVSGFTAGLVFFLISMFL